MRLYDLESWMPIEATIKNLNHLKWGCLVDCSTYHGPQAVHGMSSKNLFKRIKKEPEMMYTTKRRKVDYLGLVMKNQFRYSLL